MNATIQPVQLPYITAHLAGVGGQIRSTPEHFVVEEMPLYLPQGEGSHLYLSITKVGLTTRQVADQLEQLLGLRRGDVGYAGLKDKHARTTQMISVPLNKHDAAQVEATVEQIRSALPVEVHWARLHGNKLKAGHLLGNRFRITISELGQPATVLLPLAQAIATEIQHRGIPNYFGQQRFGVRGDNPEQGRALLRGERFVRDSWLRRFLLSSLQSELSNHYLARRLNAGLFDRLLLGDVAKKHATGGIFDVTDLSSEQPRYEAQEISFTAPMFGYKMHGAKDEAAQLEAQILDEAGISLNDWRKVRVEGTRRMGRLLVQDLKVEPVEPSSPENELTGKQMVLSFALPKGAFATTVLREFMKNDSAEVDFEGDDEE